MATIEAYVLADGRTKRYRVRYRTPERRQTDKRGFRTKRDAEQFAASVEVSKMRGEYIAPADARVTIGELGPGWLARQTHLKPSAFRPVEGAWRVQVEPRWGAVATGDIRHSDVQLWVSEMSAERSATVVTRAFGVLAAILDDAVRDRRMVSNPARGVKLPRKIKKEHVYLSHDQVHALAAEAKPPLGALVLLLAYCGLRWGEAAGLRVMDCDLLRKRLTVSQNAVTVASRVIIGTPKNHRRRSVPVPAFLVTELARQCEGKERHELLFAGRDGKPLKPPYSVDGWFEGARRRAGLPELTPHDLRHTAASFAVSAGANVKAVQRMLGHASAAMTLDVYAALFDEDLEAVGAALDQAVSAASVGKVWARGPAAVPDARPTTA